MTLVGDVALEPPGATPPSLSAIHVSVAGHSWAADTDGAGHYEISGVPVGTWVVQFTRPGWDDQVVSGIGVTLDQAGERVPLPPIQLKVSRGNVAGTIALEGEGSAGGVSVSLDAVPSASSVHWASALGAGDGAVLTGADGRFVLTGIPVGEYVLRASKVGFVDGTVASVTVTASGVTTLDRLLLFMNPGGYSGSVLVQGATSSGGVTVRASGLTLNGSPWESTTVNRADGTYLLSGVPGGSYNVSFEREGYRTAFTASTVVPGAITALPPVTLAHDTGALSGVATLQDMTDSSGTLVELRVDASATPVAATVTDALGTWRIDAAPIGTYQLTYSHPGFAPVTSSATVVSGELRFATPASLVPSPGTLRGRVALEGGADGAGTTVRIEGSTLQTVTLAGGAWSIGGVPAGARTLVFERTGFDAQRMSLTLAPGEDRPIGDVTLAISRGALSGAVRLSGLGVHAGVLVSAVGPGSATTLTDPAGDFTLSGLPTGTYTVSVRKDPDWQPVIVTGVVVNAGATAALPGAPVVLSPVTTSSLGGTVVLERPTDASGTTVTVIGHDFRGVAIAARTAITGATGAWTIADLPGGSYEVSYAHARYDAPGSVLLSLGSGESQVLPRASLAVSRGSISGTVALSAGAVTGFPVGADLSGIEVNLTGLPAGVRVAHVFTDSAGRYQFDDVPVSLATPAGAYGLTATRTNFLQTASVSVTAQANATAPAPGLTLQLDPGVIAGTVVAWDNVGGAGPNPTAPGIVVTISGTAFNGAPWSTAATTGSTGAFTAPNLPPGTYDLLPSSAGRSCAPFPRTAVVAGATVTLDGVQCVDAVAPTALTLGTPTADPAVLNPLAPKPQPGYSNVPQILIPILTRASDPTANLRGYQLATGATPDWTHATLVENPGDSLSLKVPVASDPVTRGNQRIVVWVRALDWAENTGPASSAELVYDAVPPPAPVVATPRTLVNATTSSVTLAGSDDPNFLRYEYRTDPCQDGAGGCGFVLTAASFAISLPADRSTVLYVRALDKAGNLSPEVTETIASDMTAPRPPQMAPSYDPYRLSVRAPWVEFLVATPAYDPPADQTSPWRGIAWLEVDTGTGFTPLCPAPACQDGGAWSPCNCGCTDPRLVCGPAGFAGVRAALPVNSGSTTVSFRAADLAGNVGPSTSQQVFSDASPEVIATGTTWVDKPSIRDGVVGYLDTNVGMILDLGPNRRKDPGDPQCAIGTPGSFVPWYAGVVPLGRDVVAFGQYDYPGGTQVGNLYLRLRAAGGAWCAGDSSLLVSGGTDVKYPTGDRRHLAWAEKVGSDWRVMVREAPVGQRLGTSGDGTREIVAAGTFATISGVWLGGRNLVVVGCDAGGHCTYRVTTASATGSFLSGTSVTDLSLGLYPYTFGVSKDGSALVYENGGSEVLRTPGPDGVFDGVDDTSATLRTGLGLYYDARLVDGRHAVAINATGYTGLAAFWDVGEDGLWGSTDDVARSGLLSGTYRSSADLDAGLLVYSIRSSIELLDLTTLRWEVPLLGGQYGSVNDDSLVSNGRDTILWPTPGQEVFARRAGGEQTVTGLSTTIMAADGPDLLAAAGYDHLVAYRADATGRFFTASAPPPVTLRPTRPQQVRVGGGKAIVEEPDASSSTGFRCWIGEPGAGTIQTIATTGAWVDVQPGGCAGVGYLGMTGRQAFFPCTWSSTCVVNADGNGRFSSASLASTTTLELPASSGFPTLFQPRMHVSGTRMVLSQDNMGTVLLDAGSDGLFNTSDDRARLLTAQFRPYNSELAVAGDWAVWLDHGAPGGDQVYVLHGFDGDPIQITSTVSTKGQLTVDASGRVHWIDGAVTPQAIMTWEP